MPFASVHLALPKISPLSEFDQHTRLLTGSQSFHTHRILIPPDRVGEDVPGVKDLLSDVSTRDGRIQIELAVVLSDLLPAISGFSECLVDVKGEDDIVRRMCMSNRMSRFHFTAEGTARHVLMPRKVEFHGYASFELGGTQIVAAEETLKSVVAMRFDVEGESVKSALEAHLCECIDAFLESTNVVLRATRASAREGLPLPRAVSRESIATAYLLVIGADDKSHGLQLMLGGRAVMRDASMPEDAERQFRALASGETQIDDVDRLIQEARSSWQSGEYEFAFLQAVIAAEIVTVRIVNAVCIDRGVSKKKLKELRDKLSYSWALNVGIPLAFDVKRRPAADLVAAMNNARQIRNDLMHEARFAMTRIQVDDLIKQTQAYVMALRAAAS